MTCTTSATTRRITRNPGTFWVVVSDEPTTVKIGSRR